MKVLCVEDGSVDIDTIENGELAEGKVIVYRQGSKPPFVLDIPDEAGVVYKKFIAVWEELKEFVKDYTYYSSIAKDILDKMVSLEKTKFKR